MENNTSNTIGFGKSQYETLNEGRGVSAGIYNLIMGGFVLYGIVVNIIMCMTCTNLAMTINPIALIIGYIVLVIAGTAVIHRSRTTVIRFV